MHADVVVAKRLGYRLADRPAELGERLGLGGHQLERDGWKPLLGDVGGGQQGRLPQRQRPRDAARKREHNALDDTVFDLAQEVANGISVLLSAERERPFEDRHTTSAAGDDAYIL